MRVFSTFTGIGGFELGIDHAALITGTEVEHVGYSEIDKYAVQVFEKHYEGVKNYGDITKIEAEDLPDFECLVGGFPCQAFSIAGRRKGFEDTRGTLFFDLARILRAKQPRLFVFENVKGLLNHDGGNTFRTIITTIDELGYDCQWQVLNSKNFGVPQNRERIIIVGHLRGQPRPQVFPITRSDSETANTTSDKGEIVDLTRRSPKGFKHRKDGRAGTLDANYYKGLANQERPGVLVGTLRTHKDGNGFREMKSGVAPTIPARAREDGSGQPVIITGSPTYEDGKRKVKYMASEVAPTIRATQYKSGDNQPKVLIPEATKKGYAEATVGDSINLKAINSKTRRGRVGKGIANTLEVTQHQYTVQPVQTPDRHNKSQNGRQIKPDGEPSHTLTSTDRHGVMMGGAIRRLTPMECERLQAFPDNWTLEGVDGPISDTQRYKMCGNAVTTNVIQAVFERIFA